MLFHLNHIHHQCSPALTILSGSSSDLYHLHEKNETDITKPSLLMAALLIKNSLLSLTPYICEAHTTESCLKMLMGDPTATLQNRITDIET
jgi:hypothetical protein